MHLMPGICFAPQVRDSRTNIGKGIAFVEFNSKSAAAAALRLKDVKLEGRPLRISFLKTPKPGSAAPPATSTFRNAGVFLRRHCYLLVLPGHDDHGRGPPFRL